ncbi:MAG: SulP family inorganic anion transporter [Fimbriiglobus sp.]|nr:SulP family inorganic anion transporter [Fimbriiglobus sp.]
MAASSATPRPPLKPGLFGNLRFDAIAGFLVFLIAMPLCLAIAKASGFPPIAGIWTAVAGGLIATWVSNSALTIKGPAAGLIVIVAGSVSGLGREFVPEPLADQRAAMVAAGQTDEQITRAVDDERALVGYRLTLGIGVVAGVLQVLLGLLRAGRLVDFFPLTPVHGMLASIGIIIISKQLYFVAGVTASKEGKSLPELFGLVNHHAGEVGGEPPGPIQLLMEFPAAFTKFQPEILVIGGMSLVILFAHHFIKNKWVKMVPAQLVVLVVAVTLGFAFDLDHEHKHLLPAHLFNGLVDDGEVVKWPQFLVNMPNVLAEPAKAFTVPDFRAVATLSGLKWLFLFVAIGSLESLLAAKAIEQIDPWRRKTDFDRDLIGIGLANTLVACIGGLPMISEIVRSKANIDAGGRTRGANAFHGLFLLAAVLAIPGVLHEIPLAALGAMLVFTGFRLANPAEFVKTYKVGIEQFVVFVGTIVATLATDLLIGIGVGIALKVAFHLWHGAPLKGFIWSDVKIISEGDRRVTVLVRRCALFSNWLGLQKVILDQLRVRDEVIVDLSETRLVDHSVMEKLHELEMTTAQMGKTLHVVGLENHKPLSTHPLAARKSL